MIAVAQNDLKAARREAGDKSFWDSLIKNAKIDDQLIVVIDYGFCK